jgi:hypothetical protein
MSTFGTRHRDRRVAPLARNPRAGASPAKTPYRLLWSTAIVAFMLCVAAFVLWGINGAGTLFDMLVTLCT